ncbi:MAG: hypothetical protein IKN54_08615 [Lachnospiraceae bacterium]|nr:hypothetical protein [Lachnospiraceae bacterium]
MLFYDTIFKMKNRYTPAVVRIELKKLKKNNGTVKLNIERDTTLPLTESETVGNEIVVRPSKYFSSSMRFTLAQGKGWISDSPSANQLYSRIDSGLYKRIVTDKSYTPQSIAASDSDAYAFEKGDSKIFVTNVNKDGNGNLVGMTKADSVAIKVDYTAADLIDSDSDSVGDTLNVYLYVTYEEELVENFGVSGVGSSGNAQGQIVNLINDISGMTISLE